MIELDLTKPGRLWATAEFQKTTTFHIVVPQPHYSKDALTRNPVVSPQDQLMTPFSVPYTAADKDGMASLDLDSSGRAAEIMAKLSERYERGQPRLDAVRALVIATARDGNRIPDAQVAEIIDFKLVSIPVVRLKPIVGYLTVQNYKAGKKDFTAELTVQGPVTEVQLTTSPARQIQASTGQSGTGTLKIPVVEGKKVTITVPAPFVKRTEQKQELAQRKYLHYGRDASAQWNDSYHQAWMRRLGGSQYGQATFSREVWDGGFVSLKAAGTGAYAGISQGVNFTAEAWAAAWLMTQPPAPFYHNCC